MHHPRILLAITVYDGRAVVPACLESAVRVDKEGIDLDVLVLDDASPEPGWSEELTGICSRLGVQYYCTPRNLGIPRNVNLALLRALDGEYDYVIVSNSDVIYPANLLHGLVRVHRADPTIGSVTAWSNNVSVYSIPNDDALVHLGQQSAVDWVSAVLSGEFGDAGMDVPAGISFCILIPTAVVRDVGIMDPVFGRGYCEETDWSLRSKARGYRITVAPSVFVYHHGQASTVDAGLLAGGHSSVPENEAIIDLRYPFFRNQVDAFLASDLLDSAWDAARRSIIVAAATRWGYILEVGWLHRGRSNDEQFVRVTVEPDGSSPLVTLNFRGFTHTIRSTAAALDAPILELLGQPPIALNVRDWGPLARTLSQRLAGEGVPVEHGANYPTRV